VTNRADVLGVPIDRLDMDQTLERCREYIERRGDFAQQVSINAAKLVSLRDDDAMREIVNRCDLISADGQAVVWASRLVGDPLPVRVAGIDLMHSLMSLAEDHGYGVYILGARQDVLETAVEQIRGDHPRLNIAGYRDGFYADDEADDVAREIRASGAQILFLAMSSPRKEYFLGRHAKGTGVRFAMGVGGSIDVIAGVTRRAPRAWQRVGLEWLYRALQEPNRLGRRYARTNFRFMSLLLGDMWRRRRPRTT
jgi:N-acetylglucosaminyldiphosphoundecaprenol N-acetyl-beta-D-mannosaminyltransferase